MQNAGSSSAKQTGVAPCLQVLKKTCRDARAIPSPELPYTNLPFVGSVYAATDLSDHAIEDGNGFSLPSRYLRHSRGPLNSR
jgi:hypothetical protein